MGRTQSQSNIGGLFAFGLWAGAFIWFIAVVG